MYKQKQKHTTPRIRWSSPTQLLVWPSPAYLWESGRDPEFSGGYGRMCYVCFLEKVISLREGLEMTFSLLDNTTPSIGVINALWGFCTEGSGAQKTTHLESSSWMSCVGPRLPVKSTASVAVWHCPNDHIWACNTYLCAHLRPSLL
ncbi:hypothetical protein LX36DRAFT_590708 [Colletotrichum falcatum]|nr:hypothetical protein LX36DRAFT_590708 [Colletotrichum falcatum]